MAYVVPKPEPVDHRAVLADLESAVRDICKRHSARLAAFKERASADNDDAPMKRCAVRMDFILIPKATREEKELAEALRQQFIRAFS